MSTDRRRQTDGSGAFDLEDVQDRREALIEKLVEEGELPRTEMQELHRNLVMESSIRAYNHSEMSQEDVAEDLEKYADVVRGLDS